LENRKREEGTAYFWKVPFQYQNPKAICCNVVKVSGGTGIHLEQHPHSTVRAHKTEKEFTNLVVDCQSEDIILRERS
jgi:hypothetical protein